MVSRKMRMLAASLAMVLCVSLYSVPKAKAVATEVAVGTAAVASYFQATGLTMAASAGSTGALITTGVADIAGSYAMATGAASSGSAFLSSLAAGVSISPAGAIVLTAAAVVAIGALVAWYVGENGLEEEGSAAVAVPGTSDTYLYNGVDLPSIETVWTDKATFPYALVANIADVVTRLILTSSTSSSVDSGFDNGLKCLGPCNYEFYRLTDGEWVKTGTYEGSGGAYVIFDVYPLWSNYDVFFLDGSTCLTASSSIPSGDVKDQLEVIRTPEFIQLDSEYDVDTLKEMTIDLGYPAGTTLDTVAGEVPGLIAAGSLVPTYEITTTETGEGDGTETDPEEDVGIYIPVLSDIKTVLGGLADSIVDGIMSGLKSLVVPDEAFFAEAVPALQETFQGRMGLLTFPISLLADFLGRLLDLSDQEPILRWNSVSIYGTELIAAGQYNFKDALKSAPVKQLHDIYMIAVNAILIFAFLNLCHNKYRKIVQN